MLANAPSAPSTDASPAASHTADLVALAARWRDDRPCPAVRGQAMRDRRRCAILAIVGGCQEDAKLLAMHRRSVSRLMSSPLSMRAGPLCGIPAPSVTVLRNYLRPGALRGPMPSHLRARWLIADCVWAAFRAGAMKLGPIESKRVQAVLATPLPDR